VAPAYPRIGGSLGGGLDCRLPLGYRHVELAATAELCEFGAVPSRLERAATCQVV
jgi:hypothetical protein